MDPTLLKNNFFSVNNEIALKFYHHNKIAYFSLIHEKDTIYVHI